MALFRGIQEYITLDANNRHIVSILGYIFCIHRNAIQYYMITPF